MGNGISASVEDFGGQGTPPTHPELLDRLAIEFIDSGWDIKMLVRKITTSTTYQQSSLETDWHREHDPENRLFSRQSRFRLPAEMVRDAALNASGLLVANVGGSSIKPYQPEGYYRHLNFPKRKYEASSDDGQWRRGLYVHWQRQFLHPMLGAFDAPTREECTAKRAESNTPLAALVWLNDPSFLAAAGALALRTLETDGSDSERISKMFRLVTSRKPDDAEMHAMSELLSLSREEFDQAPDEARLLLQAGQLSNVRLEMPPQGEKTVADRKMAELAAWTMLARAALNLNEVYTRN